MPGVSPGGVAANGTVTWVESRRLLAAGFRFCDLFISRLPSCSPWLHRVSLHGFIATMRALTSVGPHYSTSGTAAFVPIRRAIRVGGPGPLIEQCPLLLKLTIRHASCTRQFSLLIAFDLPTIPSPTTALPFRHGRFHTLLHRRDLPCLSPGQTSKVGGNAVARSRVRTSPGASPTGLAELSSHTLRTGRSSQVALHPSSRKMQLPLSTTGW